MLFLSVAGCLLALAMIVLSGMALRRAEIAGRDCRPYILPIFVGVAYVILRGMVVYDMINLGGPRAVVRVTGDIIDTMLILSVLLLLYRHSMRRG